MHEVVFIPNKESYRGVKTSGNAPAGRFKNVIATNKTTLMLKTEMDMPVTHMISMRHRQIKTE